MSAKMLTFDSREDWLKGRTRIGGSDAAAILGLNPYTDNQKLWAIKTGKAKAEDISDKPYVMYGTNAEAPLRELFALDFPEFQLGYKGYIQLALRSGYYKKLNVMAIKEGELVSFNPLEEDIEVNLIQDERQREEARTTGYYAMFEYLNGFRKAMYWSREKMESHALKYSRGYQAKKGFTFWEKDFDGMAYKTMLRQLISKWGIMSIEMQTAFDNDMAVIHEDGTKNYVESDDSYFNNQAEVVEVEAEEVLEEVTATEPTEIPTEIPTEDSDIADTLFN